MLDPAFLPLDLGFELDSGSESAAGPELISLLVVARLLCKTHVRRWLGKIARVGNMCAVGKVPEPKSARVSEKDSMSGTGNGNERRQSGPVGWNTTTGNFRLVIEPWDRCSYLVIS